MTRRPTPDEIQLAAAVTAYHARLNSRAEAAAGFIVALVVGILGALALVHYLTPCETGHLCAGLAGIAGRRVRAGSSSTPPEAVPLPRFTTALREARTEAFAQGERTGYVAGWRWGVVCGATAGLLAGALLITGALSLGLITGGI